jgi:hypothetical protein
MYFRKSKVFQKKILSPTSGQRVCQTRNQQEAGRPGFLLGLILDAGDSGDTFLLNAMAF